MLKLVALRFRFLPSGDAARVNAALRFACLVVAVLITACLDPLSLEGRRCDCAAGYTCCESLNICSRFCPSTPELLPVVPGVLSLSANPTQGVAVPALSGAEATAVAVGPNNELWVGTRCGGLFRFSDSKWTVFDAYNSHLPDSGIHSLLIDNSTMWITSRRGYLYSYDNTTFTVFGAEPLIFASSRARQPLLPDARGGLWFAAHSGGLGHLVRDRIDEVRTDPWSARGEPLERVTGLGQDGIGGLWATARNGAAAQWSATGWIDAAPDQAPLEARIVSPLAKNGPWFATSAGLFWRGLGGLQEVTAVNVDDTKGLALIREGSGERVAAVYASRNGLLTGTREGVAHRPVGNVRPVDVVGDGANGWWLAGGKAGVVHIKDTGEVLEQLHMEEAPLALPWRDTPVATQLEEPAIEVEITKLLSNPFALAGRKIHLHGRVVFAPPSIRFEDSTGTVRSITPTIRRELLEFWTAVMKREPNPLLPYWANGPAEMDFYGYVEIGGCNGEIEETTLQFFIAEYYPSGSSIDKRASIKAAFLKFLETNVN